MDQTPRSLLEQLRCRPSETAWKRLVALPAPGLDGARPAVVAAELGLSVNAVVLAKFRVMRRQREPLQGIID